MPTLKETAFTAVKTEHNRNLLFGKETEQMILDNTYEKRILAWREANITSQCEGFPQGQNFPACTATMNQELAEFLESQRADPRKRWASEKTLALTRDYLATRAPPVPSELASGPGSTR